jgi:hypothetical protein
MSLGIPGNSVIINFLLRFPVLVPVVAAGSIALVAPAETEPNVATTVSTQAADDFCLAANKLSKEGLATLSVEDRSKASTCIAKLKLEPK